MNCWKVTAKKLGMQFAARVQCADKAAAYLVSQYGKPILHHSEEAARLAGLDHLIEVLNGDPRYEWLGGTRSEAVALEERVFGEVTSRRGKKTTVTRSRRRKQERLRKAAIKAAEVMGV